MKINVTKSSMPSYDEYIEEIKDLWDSRWLTNNGIKHNSLQEQLHKFTDVRNVVLYTNGHLALEAIWAAYDFPRGSEVITTPFTFISTTNAIVRNGLIPVFCDVKKDDYTIDPNKIEELITEKTVAICPVHVYGHICDIDSIQSIADKYDLKVVYDAAHAFGVEIGGINVANFGDAAMFSFHATKVFNTIEGGALCFNNDSLLHKLNSLKNFGLIDQEEAEFIGCNAKMNEFQAAMGICNLRHFEEEIKKREKVVERYIKRLDNIAGIHICPKNNQIKENYAYFPIVLDGYKKTRDEIYEELLENDIVSRKYFYPIISEYQCYKNQKLKNQATPIAKYIADRVLTLPLYADLNIKDVDKICDIILNVGGSN